MLTIKKLILVFMGVALIGMGAAISIINNWGSDPISVFSQGLSIVLTNWGLPFFSIGNALIAINLITLIILIIIYKFKYIKIGTFAGMVCIGLFIDMWQKLLSNIIITDQIIYKIILMLLGVVILSIGIGVYISSDMGASPVDLISVSISESFNFSYSKTRVICDLLFMIFGWLIGGVVGIATLVCMCLIGPISGLVNRYIKNTFKF